MRTLALSILGVAIATALLVFVGFRFFRYAERLERDPRLHRRRLLRGGILYIAIAAFGIYQVANGDLPPIALIGLPVAAWYAWTLLNAARNVKIPPET